MAKMAVDKLVTFVAMAAQHSPHEFLIIQRESLEKEGLQYKQKKFHKRHTPLKVLLVSKKFVLTKPTLKTFDICKIGQNMDFWNRVENTCDQHEVAVSLMQFVSNVRKMYCLLDVFFLVYLILYRVQQLLMSYNVCISIAYAYCIDPQRLSA